jgi:hypothetical protein
MGCPLADTVGDVFWRAAALDDACPRHCCGLGGMSLARAADLDGVLSSILLNNPRWGCLLCVEFRRFGRTATQQVIDFAKRGLSDTLAPSGLHCGGRCDGLDSSLDEVASKICCKSS